MKIRDGFVSNSSSSSFIIAYKVGDPCSHCGRSNIDMSDIIKKVNYNNSVDVEAEGIDEIQNKMREIYEEELSYCHDKKSHVKEFAKFMKYCAKLAEFVDDYKLIWVTASYSDSEVIEALMSAVKAKRIIDWYY
jgi:hypothetical protein